MKNSSIVHLVSKNFPEGTLLARRYEKLDVALLTTGFVLSLASVVLIFDDRILFSKKGMDGSSASIASVSSSARDVRNRHAMEFAWSRVSPGDKLYSEDHVFSGEDSSVEIKFTSGGSLSVSANSLVTILENKDKQSVIDIREGSASFRLAANEKIHVRIGNVEHRLTSSSTSASVVRIVQKTGGTAQLSVVEGDVKLATGDKNAEIHINQRAELSENGEVKNIESFELETVEPAENAVIYRAGNEAVPFKWKPAGDGIEYTLEISSDESFSKIVRAERTANAVLQANGLSSSGRLFWRVRSSNKANKKIESLPKSFALRGEEPPAPLRPTGGEVIRHTVSDTTAERSVLLSWDDPTGASSYEVQVDGDPGFKNPQVSRKTDARILETPPLHDGKWYWRVKVSDSSRMAAPWSKASEFKIEAHELPDPFVLGGPEQEDRVYATGTDTPVSLQWNSRIEADSYQVEVARDEKFTKDLQTITTKTSKIDVKLSQQGNWYWRVHAIAKNGLKSQASHVKKFKLAGTPRITIVEPADGAALWRRPGVPTRFVWNADSSLRSFKLEFSSMKSFDEVKLTKEVSAPLLELSELPGDGTWYWRVSGGQNVESRVQSVEIRTDHPAEPELPANDAILSFGAQVEQEFLDSADKGFTRVTTAPVSFSWNDRNPSKTYRVQVSSTKEFTKNVLDSSAEGTHREGDMIGEGVWWWRVRPADADRADTPWSEPKKFKVVRRELEHGPDPLVPGDSEQVVNEAGEASVKFVWRERNAAKFYVFEMSEDSAFAKDKLFISKRVNASQLEAKLPKPGKYWWRVRAVNKDFMVTVPGRASRVELLKAERKPKLRAPKVKVKDLEFEVMIEHRLRRWIAMVLDVFIPSSEAAEVRKPHLKWEEIEGARRYYIQISKNKGFENTVLETETKEPQFLWEVSETGVYYWRVAAVDSDGQRGQFSDPGQIKVSLPPPPVGSEAADRHIVKTTKDVEEFENPLTEIELKWEKSERAKAYRVIVAYDKSYANPQVYETKNTAIKVKVNKNEQLFWKVAIIDAEKSAVGAYSKPQTVMAESKLELSKPMLEKVFYAPSLVKGEDAKAGVKITWNQIDAAKLYRVEVAKDPEFKSVLNSTATISNKFQSDIRLDEKSVKAKLYCRVRAEHDTFVSEWSDVTQAALTDEQQVKIQELRKRIGIDVIGGILLQDFQESFEDGTDTRIQSVSLVARAEIVRPLSPPRWDYWANGGIDGIAIQKDIFLTTLQAAGGASYNFRRPDKTWSLAFGAGPFMKQTVLATDRLGFKTVFGPQFNVWFRKDLTVTTKGALYAKFGPPMFGGSSISVNNRELTLGVRWIYGINFFFPIAIGAEYNRVDLETTQKHFIGSNGLVLTLGTYL